MLALPEHFSSLRVTSSFATEFFWKDENECAGRLWLGREGAAEGSQRTAGVAGSRTGPMGLEDRREGGLRSVVSGDLRRKDETGDRPDEWWK